MNLTKNNSLVIKFAGAVEGTVSRPGLDSSPAVDHKGPSL